MEPTSQLQLLVVDDDPKYRGLVARGLARSGMECEAAPDGETALELLRGRSFDLVLLDVMLPGMQGWEVLETLRAEGIGVPVIWVTARDALDERVKGLGMGGDDYVVKPFAFEELVARIQAVLRRRAARSTDRLGDLEVEPLEQRVRRAGRVLDLTPTEYGLLRRLLASRGSPVSRKELLESVWGLSFDPGTNVVEVHVRRLRKKLDEPFPTSMIHTVRGEGYVLRTGE